MIVQLEGHTLQVEGHRQLSTVTTNVIPVPGQISEALTITVASSGITSDKWLNIKRKKGWNPFALFGQKLEQQTMEQGFAIQYNSSTILQLIRESGILMFEELRKVSLNAKGFELKMFELPGEIQNIQRMMSFCSRMIT